MPTGTIKQIGVGQITLALEVDGEEKTINFPTTPRVDEWIASHLKDFHSGSVVEYAATSGIIGKITPAGGFTTTSVSTPGRPPLSHTSAQTPIQTPAPTPTPTVSVTPRTTAQFVVQKTPEVIGTFDPLKVRGYRFKTTCNIDIYENISVEVEATDPETGRLALIDGYNHFGQADEFTRDRIQTHIKRALLRDTRP